MFVVFDSTPTSTFEIRLGICNGPTPTRWGTMDTGSFVCASDIRARNRLGAWVEDPLLCIQKGPVIEVYSAYWKRF
ncbi:hypothetical protein TNCV_559101 [Trichonephila clavipes]|nr:hypothetical protein TNCV_559101 [Trichonephila clavipes]